MSIAASKKDSIRQFYSEAVVEHITNISDSFKEFIPDCKIGWVDIKWNYSNHELLKPEVQRLPKCLPQSLITTFERHLWYSRHNLTDIFVLKVAVNDIETFLFLFEGHCNDAWDNGCQLIELFDSDGDSIGSGFLKSGGRWENGVLKQWIDWVDRSLKGNDYWKPAPPYPDDGDIQSEPYHVCQSIQQPIWSEDGNYPVSFE